MFLPQPDQKPGTNYASMGKKELVMKGLVAEINRDFFVEGGSGGPLVFSLMLIMMGILFLFPAVTFVADLIKVATNN